MHSRGHLCKRWKRKGKQNENATNFDPSNAACASQTSLCHMLDSSQISSRQKQKRREEKRRELMQGMVAHRFRHVVSPVTDSKQHAARHVVSPRAHGLSSSYGFEQNCLADGSSCGCRPLTPSGPGRRSTCAATGTGRDGSLAYWSSASRQTCCVGGRCGACVRTTPRGRRRSSWPSRRAGIVRSAGALRRGSGSGSGYARRLRRRRCACTRGTKRRTRIPAS